MSENPWLGIPLDDYEGHMAHVGQAGLLDRLFAKAIAELRPRSVAVLGAAGGNGFGALAGSTAVRTVAVDLNPDYLGALERRYAGAVESLETVCGDIADPALAFDMVEYVHAALVFEYVDPAAALANIGRWLAPRGHLGVVLQLPGATGISPSPFASLARLGPAMRLHDEQAFAQIAQAAGFEIRDREAVDMPGGKRFAALRLAFGRGLQKR